MKKMLHKKQLKIKPLSKEQLIISADRLTRFKHPEIKYLRVFKEIILNNLIEPKFKKHELDETDYDELKYYAESIINYSLGDVDYDLSINQKLAEYENSIFIIGKNTEKLLNNKINYLGIVSILPDNIPENLKFLKSLCDSKYLGGFPIRKLILCEGITEEILLPEFAKLCGYDFSENGVYIVSAGGKNQVVKYFYNFAQCLKIPIFILLDNDAKENINQLTPKLRNFDKIHLVKSGEFEDLLPENLIIKTLNYATENISTASYDEIKNYGSHVEFLTEFFRHRGMHEFKKAEFAQLVKKNISEIEDISTEIKEIIGEIFNTLKV